MNAALREKAVAEDDGLPDNVCPGCGQDITGWETWIAHHTTEQRQTREYLAGRLERNIPLNSIETNESSRHACPWTHDMLSARRYRRLLIAGKL